MSINTTAAVPPMHYNPTAIAPERLGSVYDRQSPRQNTEVPTLERSIKTVRALGVE
jgi:hypothetical protein